MQFRKNTAVALIGGGGHAYVVLETLTSVKVQVDFVVDPKIKNFRDSSIEVLKNLEDLKLKEFDNIDFYIGIGDAKLRNALVAEIKSMFNKFEFPKLIHPNSVIYSNVNIGEGTQILAGSIIGPNTKIGSFSILNHFVLVDHDCKIGDFCNLSPRVSLGGNVFLEDRTFVGIGAAISNNIHVSSNSIIGALTFLNKDLPVNSKYLGH